MISITQYNASKFCVMPLHCLQMHTTNMHIYYCILYIVKSSLVAYLVIIMSSPTSIQLTGSLDTVSVQLPT